ncbi:MAG TPA: heavy metal translocating P-type ATPase [Candidatus Aquicultor sp.]
MQKKRSYIEEAQDNYIIKGSGNSSVPTLESVYELRVDRALNLTAIIKTLRNAFLVTLVTSMLIILDSPISERMLGFRIRLPIPDVYVHLLLATIALIFGGIYFFRTTWQSLAKSKIDASILTSLAVATLYLFSIGSIFFFAGANLFYAATLILTFSLLAQWMKFVAWRQITGSTISLLDELPAMADVVRGEDIVTEPAQKVYPGDVALVRAGERAPVDGVVTEGEAAIEWLPITGKTGSAVVKNGDEVLAGSRCIDGEFRMEATRVGQDTLLARVVNAADAAQRSQPQEQEFMETAISYFTLMVIVLAVFAFIIWDTALAGGLSFALIIAVAILVAASPEALSLTIPLVVSLSTGFAARHGILIKDAATVERLTHTKTVVFDEVASLIEGEPRVSDVYHVGKLTEPGFIRLAASLAKAGQIPYADAIITAAQQGVGRSIPVPEEFAIVTGCGAMGTVETRRVMLGNRRLMVDRGINIFAVEERAREFAEQGKTVVYVAVDDRIEGILGIEQTLAARARDTVKELHSMGLTIVLLTGDDKHTAQSIAERLALDEVYAEVLPSAKAQTIKELQQRGKFVAVVTRGTKDSSTLKQADIGIVTGVGTATDMRAGDIEIINNDLVQLSDTFLTGKKVESKIRENSYWAVVYNIIVLIVATGVFYPSYQVFIRPEAAAVFMAASAAMVIFNSLSLRGTLFRSFKSLRL